ncbi:MAG TPA: hypothetical protein VFL80_08255 [Thermoanaerobaculia bacterium]|nr:hypothetical protein [Thermoanaerobaculia bacterium]
MAANAQRWRSAAERLELPATLLILLAATLLVRPFGDFPLNDDENHAIGTWNFARDLEFRFTIGTTPPLRAQVVWGALWTWMFGESFEVLRASTLVLAGIALLIFNRSLLMAGVGFGLRMTATLALLFNPIFFWSAHTYMTEVPFVCASAAAFYCFVRAVRDERTGWFIAGCCAVAISWWIRQGIVNLLPPMILLAWYRERITVRWRRFLAIAAITGTGYVLMALLRPTLIVASTSEFYLHYKMWGEETFRIPEIATLIASYIFFNMQHATLFFLPLSAAAAASFRAIRERRQVIAFAILAIFLFGRMTQLVVRGAPIPYYTSVRCCEITTGNILMNLGLGPPTLPDVWGHINEYSLRFPHGGRVALSYASVAIATVAIALLLFAARSRFAVPRANLVFVFGASLALVGTLALCVSGQYIDRYSLDSAWSIGLLLPLVIAWNRPVARWIAGIAVMGMAVFCILAVQEYFSWNRLRWVAFWELRNRGVRLEEIDAGAEPFLFYEVSQARTLSERRRMAFGPGKREYLIAFAAMPDTRVIARRSYSGWLGTHRGEVVTLQRVK